MSYLVVYSSTYADDDSEITLVGHYHPGLPGSRDRYGVPIEPDDDPEMEIVSATNEAGDEVELTESERERAIAKLWEAL